MCVICIFLLNYILCPRKSDLRLFWDSCPKLYSKPSFHWCHSEVTIIIYSDTQYIYILIYIYIYWYIYIYNMYTVYKQTKWFINWLSCSLWGPLLLWWWSHTDRVGMTPWSSRYRLSIFRWESTRPGKHTKNYGKSPFLMGKSTIFIAIFNSYVTNYQRVSPCCPRFSWLSLKLSPHFSGTLEKRS